MLVTPQHGTRHDSDAVHAARQPPTHNVKPVKTVQPQRPPDAHARTDSASQPARQDALTNTKPVTRPPARRNNWPRNRCSTYPKSSITRAEPCTASTTSTASSAQPALASRAAGRHSPHATELATNATLVTVVTHTTSSEHQHARAVPRLLRHDYATACAPPHVVFLQKRAKTGGSQTRSWGK